MQLSTDAFGATGLLRSFGEFVASEALAGPRSAFEGYENVLPFVRATDDVPRSVSKTLHLRWVLFQPT